MEIEPAEAVAGKKKTAVIARRNDEAIQGMEILATPKFPFSGLQVYFL